MTFHYKISLYDKDIDESTIEIPEWQMNEVRDRLAEYKKNPKSGLDFNEAMDDIEKDFCCLS